MAAQCSYLNNMMGKVIEVRLPYKAIVSFQYRTKTERALLRADKIIQNGKNVPMGETIDKHLEVGSMVKFTCHSFDETGQDRCGYFVTMAWKQDPSDENCFSSRSDCNAFLGIYNASGVISDVYARQGVITYTDANGKEQNILFLASKLFLFGKRLSAKQQLPTTLSIDDKVQFDAVPCVPNENDYLCSWFASVVWKGKKPCMEYDNPLVSLEPKNLVTEIKQLASNPKSQFVRVHGQILQILNEEFGVALGAKKVNNWESILFHRSSCFLFKLNLANHDLTKIFKEGDRILAVAVVAPKHFITQWVASQVAIDTSKVPDFSLT